MSAQATRTMSFQSSSGLARTSIRSTTITTMNDVTKILLSLETGDPTAADQLLPLVYQELRKLAADKLRREQPGQTLQATALVHEAWIRLVGSDVEMHWNGRGHFFGAAARAMQRILVENARRKKSLKAGGDHRQVELSQDAAQTPPGAIDVLVIDEALQKLEAQDQRKAELVRLRFFAGLTLEEAARALRISVSTADNDWAYAKAWLRVEMAETG
jgi:RNA polymerase sigma factor (TIGR02999 family)